MLLSFSANTQSQEVLEKSLIGRRETLDQIEQELIEKVSKSRTYQSLLIAPRGSGKTHMTAALRYRIKGNKNVEDKILIAYMNEDERGIANFSDFIRHILLSFIKHKEGAYETLNDLIYEVSGMPIPKQEGAFVRILLDFIGKKGLIILIENLNILFDKKTGMGLDGQTKLRSLMHENNQFSILATTQNLFHQIQDPKAPFYNFFNIKHLEKLTIEETLEFIKIQTELENDAQLLDDLDTPLFRGKVRAIFQLTGGNHRLLVIFFKFLKAEIKSELSDIFEKTMNDLKPYYEQFLNILSPQQQKIIQYLSSEHTPQMGKNISRFCFIPPTVLSKQTSELEKKGYLDKNKVGKDTYYELKEALMRICFEINKNANGVVKLFVDFIRVLFTEEEQQKTFLKQKYFSITTGENERKRFENEARLYRSALKPDIAKMLDEIPINELCENIEELDKAIEDVLSNLNKKNQSNELKNIKKESISIILSEPEFKNKYGISKKGFEKLINSSHLRSEQKLDFITLLDSTNEENIRTLKTALLRIQELNQIIKNLEKGIKHLEKKEYNKALPFFDHSIKSNPELSFGYIGKGEILLRSKQFKEAKKLIKKGLEIDRNNRILIGGLHEALVCTNDHKEGEIIFEKIHKFSQENGSKINFNSFLKDETLYPLLKFTKINTAKDYFKFIIKSLTKKQSLPDLWQAFPQAIFKVLINIEEYPEERLDKLYEFLKAEFAPYKEMIMPLLYLDNGIRYLKKGDPRAIYDFSKEERQIFKEFVLDKREAKVE